MDSVESVLLAAQERLAKQLELFVAGSHQQFRRSYRHVLEAPAKRLRPTLVYITADVFSMPRTSVDDFALAIELIHTATLIFDDLPGQDDADLRRGRKTLHKAFGEAEAQMAGLALIFDAEKLIAGTDSDNTLDGSLMQYVNESIGQRGLCLGQLKDLQTFNGAEALPYDADLLDTIAELKTGKAIEASVVGSAMIAKQPETVISYLKTYTYHAGLAFQVKDDLLDYTSDETITGKTTNLDATNQKPNYISVLGLETTEAKLVQHVARAKQALRKLPAGLDTRQYTELVDFVAERDR